MRSCHRDSLRVVSGGAGDDAFPFLLGIELLHHIERAPKFEGKDGLQIFALEEDGAASLGGEVDAGLERRLLDKIVDVSVEDETQVVGRVVGLHEVGWQVGVEMGGRGGVGGGGGRHGRGDRVVVERSRGGEGSGEVG